MPRAKPKSGSAQWSAGRLPLSPDAKSELASLLGYDVEAGSQDKNDELASALAEVEKCLGMYAGAVEALQGAPRPAHFQAACDQITKKSESLLEDLEKLHLWIRNTLSEQYAEQIGDTGLSDIENRLQSLVTAARDVGKLQQTKESRGRPNVEAEALREIVRRLRNIFALRCIGCTSARKRKGAITMLSEIEQDEVDFIKIALKDAKIPCPRDLRRVIGHPECALSTERNFVVKKLARKIGAERKKQEARLDKTTKSS